MILKDRDYDELPFPEDDVLSGDTTCADQSADPCDNCPGCILKCRFEPLIDEDDAFRLIRFMLDDILRLEAEVVRWRQVLLKHLDDKLDVQNLYADILSDLASPIALYSFDTYSQFVNCFCNGKDPQEAPEHTDLMLRLRDGIDDTSIHFL